MNIFYDTSALVKFFHEEVGTAIVTEQINNQENKIYVSEQEAKKILLHYGKNQGLRTLDAIQLATFSLLRGENWLFAACDDVLLTVANAMDAKTINPLDEF